TWQNPDTPQVRHKPSTYDLESGGTAHIRIAEYFEIHGAMSVSHHLVIHGGQTTVEDIPLDYYDSEKAIVTVIIVLTCSRMEMPIERRYRITVNNEHQVLGAVLVP